MGAQAAGPSMWEQDRKRYERPPGDKFLGNCYTQAPSGIWGWDLAARPVMLDVWHGETGDRIARIATDHGEVAEALSDYADLLGSAAPDSMMHVATMAAYAHVLSDLDTGTGLHDWTAPRALVDHALTLALNSNAGDWSFNVTTEWAPV